MAGSVENPRLEYSKGYEVLRDLTVESYQAQLAEKALEALKPVLDPLRNTTEGSRVVKTTEDILAGNEGEVEVPQSAILALLEAHLLHPTAIIDRKEEIDDPTGFKDIVGERGFNRIRIIGRASAYEVNLPGVLPQDYTNKAHIRLDARFERDGSRFGKTDFNRWTLSLKKAPSRARL